MEQIRALAVTTAQRERLGEFFRLAQLLVQHRGSPTAAMASVDGRRALPRVQTILKTAVTAGTLSSPTFASALADYQIASTAFSESLRQSSTFDAMLPWMRRAPLRSRGAIVVTGITGSGVAENHVKPVSRLSLATADLDEKKASAIVVVSEEVSRFQNYAATQLFNAELTSAVAAATDSVFLSALYAGTTPSTSAGVSAAQVLADLTELLTSVSVNAQSRLYWIMSPTRAKSYSTLFNTTGSLLFPQLTVTGGPALAGVTILVSDAAMVTSTSIMVDAQALVADTDIVTLDGSRTTTLQLNDASDSPPTSATSVVSLWQSNLRALRAERFFGFVVTRTTGVAALTY